MRITIHTLYEQGHNKSEISRLTRHDWKTVNKILKMSKKEIMQSKRKKSTSKLDLHKETILKYLGENLSKFRIWEELRKQGLQVGYSTVKDYCSKIKKRENIFMRIHTKVGEEAQVDFGYCGYLPDKNNKRRKAWVFNMRLSYSRLDYYEIVYDQKVETFINCHINAFKFFGGVPRTVKIDNLKSAILEANFYEPIFQRQYQEFANYYNFKSLPCRVYRPNDKGKVESGIKYFKCNFIAGRKFITYRELKNRIEKWIKLKCNARIHGTTRKVPEEVFLKEEKDKLIPLPTSRYEFSNVGTRKVYHDCHIYVEYNYYSVPFEYIGYEVEIKLNVDLLKIYYCGKTIAIHKTLDGKGNFSTNKAHYPKYKVISETEYQEKYQAKMAELGKYAEQLFFLLLDKTSNAWKRPVMGILSLEKKYSKEIVNLACKRALFFGVCKYRVIKNICGNGSWKMPVELNSEVFYATT